VRSGVAIGAAGTAKCIALCGFGRVRLQMAIKHNVSSAYAVKKATRIEL